MNRAVFLILLAVFSAAWAAADATYHYESESGGQITPIRVVISSTEDGYRVGAYNADNDLTYEAFLDGDYRTRRYTARVRELGMDYSAEVNYPVLSINGVRSGKTVDKEVKLKDPELRHYFAFQLKPFVLSSKTSVRFTSIRPDNFEAYEFEAKKEKLEKIVAGGVEVEALRVKVRLTGLLSLLYGTTLWYRPSDGVLLRQDDRDAKGKSVQVYLIREE